MNPFIFYFRPQIMATLTQVLQHNAKQSENDVYLENWMLEKYSERAEYLSLWKLLEKIGAVEFNRYCGDWFRELALGYDVYEEIGKDEKGEPVYENFIKLTQLGQQFIEALYANHKRGC